MSIRIKVSYTEEEELYEVIRRLMPIIDVKLQPQKGQYKRAYIDIKDNSLSSVLVNENPVHAPKNR